MTQQEIFEGISGDEEEVIETPVKEVKKQQKKKPKRILSEERKEQLKEQLKRGREKSMETRRKNKLLKEADKIEKDKLDKQKIAKVLLGKDLNQGDEIEKLKAELENLKNANKPKQPQKKEEPKLDAVKEEPKTVEKKEQPTPPPAPKPTRKVFDTRKHKKNRRF